MSFMNFSNLLPNFLLFAGTKMALAHKKRGSQGLGNCPAKLGKQTGGTHRGGACSWGKGARAGSNKGVEDVGYLTLPKFISHFCLYLLLFFFHGLSLAMAKAFLRSAWNNYAQDIKVSFSAIILLFSASPRTYYWGLQRERK